MSSILILLLKYKYLILFPLAAFEGPIVALIAGFLVFSGVLNFWLAYLILLFGDIIPDGIYYYIGYSGSNSGFAQRHLLNSKLFINHFDIVRKFWKDHPWKTMFFGKLAYGMATPFLLSAGMVKMKYKKFFTLTIPITVLQYGIIMTIGYYMGNSYESALKYIDYGYIFLAIVLIIIIVTYIIIMKYARKKVEEMEIEETIK